MTLNQTKRRVGELHFKKSMHRRRPFTNSPVLATKNAILNRKPSRHIRTKCIFSIIHFTLTGSCEIPLRWDTFNSLEKTRSDGYISVWIGPINFQCDFLWLEQQQQRQQPHYSWEQMVASEPGHDLWGLASIGYCAYYYLSQCSTASGKVIHSFASEKGKQSSKKVHYHISGLVKDTEGQTEESESIKSEKQCVAGCNRNETLWFGLRSKQWDVTPIRRCWRRLPHENLWYSSASSGPDWWALRDSSEWWLGFGMRAPYIRRDGDYTEAMMMFGWRDQFVNVNEKSSIRNRDSQLSVSVCFDLDCCFAFYLYLHDRQRCVERGKTRP